ncbi:MAG: hypothetical protein HXY40_03570 [Chloroflexi bacterium]|nr:hypothetical protein [Chloroflexota bacterium]
MSIEGLGISLLILVLGLLAVAQPFFRRAKTPKTSDVLQRKERETLLNDYERVLATMRDLDEDYQLGKLPPEAYSTLREHWAAQGTTLLEALEKLNGVKPGARAGKKAQKAQTVPADAADEALDAAIEQAIANYVKAKNNASD